MKVEETEKIIYILQLFFVFVFEPVCEIIIFSVIHGMIGSNKDLFDWKYSAAQTVAEWLELLMLDYHRLLTFISKEFGCKCQLIKEQNASLFSSVLATLLYSLSLSLSFI